MNRDLVVFHMRKEELQPWQLREALMVMDAQVR